ncbi:tRNA (adenosine(37)-N6)-threonylcarbamoyltransferase complex ATPase subunit type 1 TsaE [Nocardioides sp.]|uniref:tRNA (adenosine(37)-N6)-threonylcarbamoyltransferase complex ATPase subunit type 1 TsaE n=1 Tax=Nocardioides sp. TaxID=35761 RepID=UPI003517AA92
MTPAASGPGGTGAVSVRRVGPESAGLVLDLIREAFANRPVLDPPADALTDTRDSISTRLALGGGLVARVDGEPVGCLLLEAVGDTMWLRRFGVLPAARGRGVAPAMVQAAEEASGGRSWLKVVAREELPATVAFWQRRGFVRTDSRRPYVELTRRTPLLETVTSAEAMRALGERVAADLRAGDVLVLSGDLGAGKTTFTQGLARGLGVAGAVTSPTFVIAREHEARGEGPGLVHVDAYRLGGSAELDDLDLDASLEDVVTVVEWGEGLAEGLAESRMEIRIRRLGTPAAPDVGQEDGEDAEVGDVDEPRLVEIRRLGERWVRDLLTRPPAPRRPDR